MGLFGIWGEVLEINERLGSRVRGCFRSKGFEGLVSSLLYGGGDRVRFLCLVDS